MFSKMFKPTVVFVILMAFIVTPVGITTSETKHEARECNPLTKAETCTTISQGNCTSSQTTIKVTSGDCDTYNGGYTCYEFSEDHKVGTTMCQWINDNCVPGSSGLTTKTFTNCREESNS